MINKLRKNVECEKKEAVDVINAQLAVLRRENRHITYRIEFLENGNLNVCFNCILLDNIFGEFDTDEIKEAILVERDMDKYQLLSEIDKKYSSYGNYYFKSSMLDLYGDGSAKIVNVIAPKKISLEPKKSTIHK